MYNVDVEIKHVDMAESYMCGYLRIQGLFLYAVCLYIQFLSDYDVTSTIKA